MDNVEEILALIGRYGYLIVFFGVMLESAGVPIPGETILIAAGILVQRGRLDPADAILFGALGAIIGDQVGYWVGREGGRPFVLRWGRYLLVTPERLRRAEDFFGRHGGKAVFLARFVAGLRVFGALVAGISRMRWSTFFLFNALGGIVWAAAAVTAGALLGGSLSLVERWMGRASVLLVIVLAAGAGLYLAYRWVGSHPGRVKAALGRVEGGDVQAFLQSSPGRWLTQRFDPRGVYGLFLTVGIFLAVSFSWAFGVLLQGIASRDPLVRVDTAILGFVHARADPTFTAAVVVFGEVSSPRTLLLAGAGVGLGLAGWRRRRPGRVFSGVVLLAATIGAGALIEVFKLAFDRPRPPASLRLVAEAGSGFPSGHATAALVVGAVVLYLWGLRPAHVWGSSWTAKARVALGVVFLVLLVGLGRIYLGAQYPSDVLAGWALGAVWASICVTAAEVYRRLQAGAEE